MIRFASRALLLIPLVAVISVLVLADQGKPALAGAAFVPTRFDDPAPDGCQPADCSLREAIIAANNSPGSDTITLGAGTYTLAIAGAGQDDGDAANGDLDIWDPVTLNGAGAATTVIDGGAIDRIVTIWSEETVTISRVAIRNGNAGTRSGGGIANWGALEMNESTVTANRSVNCGGGIASFGGENTTATITSSTISGNSAAACAGGIYNQGQFGVITIIGSTIRDNEATGGRGGGITNFGSATITGSTISGNTATTDGGGIWTTPDSGALTLTSSTVSGNSADGEGGGIYVSESGSFATGLFNSTVAFNIADSDGDGIGGVGGVANTGPAASLDHTIIARNADAGSPSAPDCAGEFTSQGHNLIQDPTCPISGDFIAGQDPLLGPLADNGGPTQTHALLAGSPAINSGDDGACPFTDQRGYGRVGVCDIGAYEFGGAAVTIKQGDVNCDNAITAVDALFMLRFVAGILPVAECLNVAGDVNCDGDKTAVDALGVLRFVVDLPVNQGELCPKIGTPV